MKIFNDNNCNVYISYYSTSPPIDNYCELDSQSESFANSSTVASRHVIDSQQATAQTAPALQNIQEPTMSSPMPASCVQATQSTTCTDTVKKIYSPFTLPLNDSCVVEQQSD